MITILILSIILAGCNSVEQATINNFEECIAAGNPAIESYPRQCRDSVSDKTFTEVIDTPVEEVKTVSNSDVAGLCDSLCKVDKVAY